MTQHFAPPPSPLRLLVIASDADMLGDAGMLHEALGIPAELVHAPAGRPAVSQLRRERVDVLLCELACLADLETSMELALGRLVRLAEDALILTLSESQSVSAAMEAMRAGAHDHAVLPMAAPALAARVAALAMRHGRIDLPPTAGAAADDADQCTHPALPGAGAETAILPMWRQEQMIIETAILRFGGNIAMAAAALEISPSTIYRKRQAWAEMAGETRGAA